MTEAAAAEVADDETASGRPARPPTARRSRGTRSGELPSRPSTRAGRRRSTAATGIVAWKAVSKTATCGTAGRAPARAPRAREARARCATARGASARRAPRRRRRRHAPARGTAPLRGRCDARPRRCPPAGRRASLGAPPRRASSSDVELEARRARVDDEDAAQNGQVQSRTSGWSSPCGARPGPRLEPPVVHLLPEVRGPGGEPGHAVDDVLHEVEPVEVVQHHHVERRRRRALLLVAAHVQVAVVRAAVGEAVDQPRIAVVGEDDRPIGA